MQAKSGSGVTTVLALLIGAMGGAFVWLAIAGFDLRREAWDHPVYFTIGLPAVLVLSLLLGAWCPRSSWIQGMPPMMAQAVVMLVGNPDGDLTLLPLGLGAFGIMSLPCIGAAALGGLLRTRMQRRRTFRER